MLADDPGLVAVEVEDGSQEPGARAHGALHVDEELVVDRSAVLRGNSDDDLQIEAAAPSNEIRSTETVASSSADS